MGGSGTRDCLTGFAAARAITLAAVSPLSQTQLDFSPRPGRWSIGEIADHLLLAEDLYRGEVGRLIDLARSGQRPYIRRSFADVNVSPLHIPDTVLTMLEMPFSLMSRMIPESVRGLVTEFPLLPTRNPDFATPRPRRPAAEIKSDLMASIAKTQALVASNSDLDFERMVSEHPLTGPTNVPQIFTFLARHERRHQGQMEGVRGDQRFPTV